MVGKVWGGEKRREGHSRCWYQPRGDDKESRCKGKVITENMKRPSASMWDFDVFFWAILNNTVYRMNIVCCFSISIKSVINKIYSHRVSMALNYLSFHCYQSKETWDKIFSGIKYYIFLTHHDLTYNLWRSSVLSITKKFINEWSSSLSPGLWRYGGGNRAIRTAFSGPRAPVTESSGPASEETAQTAGTEEPGFLRTGKHTYIHWEF